MNEFIRKEPRFALCGLNCCLCPRFHTEGSSKCPGCGGAEFSSKHPTCAVVTCNKKHENVEYCFECSEYPCKRYEKSGSVDSFITYRNVLSNFAEAKNNIRQYLTGLKKRHEYLVYLLENHNEGKSKGLYCLAVNLLPLSDLSGIIKIIRENQLLKNKILKERAKEISKMFKEKANESGIELILRKQK